MSRRARAYTLLEMLVTATVLLVVLGAVIIFITQNRRAAADRLTVNQSVGFVDNVRDYYRHVSRDTRYAHLTASGGLSRAISAGLFDGTIQVNRFGSFTTLQGTTRCPTTSLPGCTAVGTDTSWFKATLEFSRLSRPWGECDLYTEAMRRTRPKRMTLKYGNSSYTTITTSKMNCQGDTALQNYRSSNPPNVDLEVTFEWE